ncbi:hypothetical protein B0H17DRAFT_1055096 [Mycena rosella]|uniref:Uncharacterized protein n=1 Tax=Mycena rosella TaxID=1033263 RepID=A0AAD7GHT4_MYCRO|nr:hypothetical protein B0H17DRAFT_1055096 [Mycena rosella]
MHFLKVAVLALFPLAWTVLAAPSPRQSTSGTIISPADGTVIAPGQAFDFVYDSMADYGVTSYNYTVWLLTSPPTSFAQSTDFAQGHFFGRFAEPNYPGSMSLLLYRSHLIHWCDPTDPNPPNTPPAQLVMPDFSKNPGGWGSGASDSNGQFALLVLEEFATGSASVGSRLALAINNIVYNATAPAS